VTQHKSLKRRVRARMAKTGERYTAARRQVLARAPAEPSTDEAAPLGPPAPAPADLATLSTSEAAMRRATGQSHAEWFALLDAWGATGHSHTEIADWLAMTHGVPSWWRQSITVDYERGRGMRGKHQMADGFSVSVTRTFDVDAERALAAFTDASIRARWLPDAPLRSRPTRAKLTARFDWSDPASRVVVTIVPKGADGATVAVTHERLPDAESAARQRAAWRARLGALPAALEG